MAEDLMVLKRKAVKLGMAKATALEADRATLEKYISKNGKAKKSGVQVVAKKKKVTKKVSEAPAKKKVGRPKKVSTSAPAVKKSATAGKAKRPASAAKPKKASSDDSGRHLLGKIDYSKTDGWNPRPGSAVDRITKALRRFKGNRAKVFDFLVGDISDFVKPKHRNGERLSKSEKEEALRYRIARTDFEFARRTGQHVSATNRIKYGTGSNGKAKPAAKAPVKAAKKSAATPAKKSTGKKRGRPKGSKNKAKK